MRDAEILPEAGDQVAQWSEQNLKGLIMLLKLGIVAAVGYGIYRYATTNSDMAMAYSGGESGTGRVDSDDYATPYSASDDLTGIPGIGSSNIAAQGSRTPHLDQPQ